VRTPEKSARTSPRAGGHGLGARIRKGKFKPRRFPPEKNPRKRGPGTRKRLGNKGRSLKRRRAPQTWSQEPWGARIQEKKEGKCEKRDKSWEGWENFPPPKQPPGLTKSPHMKTKQKVSEKSPKNSLPEPYRVTGKKKCTKTQRLERGRKNSPRQKIKDHITWKTAREKRGITWGENGKGEAKESRVTIC